MKEGLQSSVCSSFAEIPGPANVGSPVNLKKNPNGVIGSAILAEVAIYIRNLASARLFFTDSCAVLPLGHARQA